MDRLQAMRTFVRVAEVGNFSAVAQQSGVAPSAVTRQVSALERELGVKLMSRSTRRLALTSAGSVFLEKARVILDLVDAAEAEIAAERAVVRGHIRLGLPLTYGLRRLAPLLLDFAERHPEVSLEMDYNDRRLDLLEEGFDLSIRVTARLAPSDVVRRLGEASLVALASPAYLAAHGTPRHPSELARHACLVYTGVPRPNAWDFSVGGRAQSFVVQSRLAADNGDVLAEAAARGLGITLAPDFIAESYLAEGRLVRVLEAFAPPAAGVYALLPGARFLPYRVRVLLDFLFERLGGGGRPAPGTPGPGRGGGARR